MDKKREANKITIEREYNLKSKPSEHKVNQVNPNNGSDNNNKQSDYEQVNGQIDEMLNEADSEMNSDEKGLSEDKDANRKINDQSDEEYRNTESESEGFENKDNGRKSLNLNRNTADTEHKGGKDSLPESLDDLETDEKISPMNEASQEIENIKSKFKVASTISATIVKILINPLFWIAIMLIIVVTYFISTITIIGQNDYNIMCDSSGVGSIIIDPNADDFTRQSAVASWLTSTPFEFNGGQSLSKEQASGIIGNLMEESYGANPKAIQGDGSLKKWETTDNNTVLSWGNVGGKAIGIIQWDRGRRINLVNFAISEGTQWHDLTTQLKFLKSEMDTGYEKDQLIKGGFNESGKSVADYAKIWNVHFERSGAAGTPAGDNPRIASAEAFAGAYTGGSYGGGLSTNCVGGLYSGGGIDASNLIQLAIQSSWPSRGPALGRCAGLVNCGQHFANEGYKQAKIAAELATSKDPIPGLLASCDRFVATMYRATGQDSNFPWGDTSIQGNYMRNSPNWEQVSCKDRQPGDVLWRPGHIMLYLGNVNGRDSIGSASYMERTGSLSGVSCSGDNFVGDGDTAIGFRKVR